MTENRKAPLDWSAFTRRPPTLRKGALIRLQDGSMAKITLVDPADNRLVIGNASRFVVWVRRAIGNWDRRMVKLGGEMLKGHTVPTGVEDAGPVTAPLWSRLLCRAGIHDWRDGPGQPCTVCGEHDWVFCTCDSCYLKHGSKARERQIGEGPHGQ